MGQSKGGGYTTKPALAKPQIQALMDALGQSQGLMGQGGEFANQAAQGFQQFLPGGGGGDAIIKQAQQRYQQETIPQILSAFGSDTKGSSALNQALAASGANLNTDLAAQLSQMQLQAAGGLGSLGQGQQGLGLSQLGLGATTPTFQHLQRQMPFWQQALLAGIAGSSSAAQGYLTGRSPT